MGRSARPTRTRAMPKTTDRPKAYSYVRFSTPDQQRGDSLRRQTEAAAKWATSRGVELDNSSYQDLGISAFRGANAETGMLGEFRRAVEDGIIANGSYLLIENLDRLSRDKPRKAVRLLEEICESGITVVTLSDQKEYSVAVLDEDPMAMMWALMTAMRANEESITKSRRVREAWGRLKAQAATDKRPMTKRVPAWLILSDDRSEIQLIGDRTEVVRRIFREAIAGAGQHRIAHMLTTEGVQTFGDGNRKSSVWQRSYIKKILSNPAVIGTLVPHSTRVVNGKRVRDPLPPVKDYYPAAVSVEDWERVNGVGSPASSPRMRGKTGEVSSLLASLATCPLCGSTMTRVNKGRGNGVPYLVCTTAKSGGGCRYRQVRIEGVEEAIRERASELFVSEMPAPDEALNVERDELEMQEHATLESIGRLLDEVERGGSSRALRERLSLQEEALVEIRTSLAKAKEKIGGDIRLSVERRLRSLVEMLERPDASPTAINSALRQTFSKCVVNYRTGCLEFHWRHSERPTELVFGWPEELDD